VVKVPFSMILKQLIAGSFAQSQSLEKFKKINFEIVGVKISGSDPCPVY
jgi:hypothetical protein